jgi:CDGSH-type Zn-finger protein
VASHTARPRSGYIFSTRARASVEPAARVASAQMDDEATITPYRDGPLLVRGPFRLTDQDGNDIEVRRETIALCRCGKSRMRPFCDGTHKIVRFNAPSAAERR